MPDQYTSIATQPGIATEHVQDLWDLAVGEELRALPTARDFVSVRPKRPMAPGSSITMTRYAWPDDAAVQAALTPLDEESDVDAHKLPKPSTVTLTPTEYGDAVVRTKKLSNRTFAPVDPYAVKYLAYQARLVVDNLVQDALGTKTAVTVDGGPVGSLTNSDVLTAAIIRRVVTRMRTDVVPTWYSDAYAGLVHPHVILDLREDTDPAGWREPNSYGSDQSRIWNGEVGKFEGVRFVENSLVRHKDDGSGGTEVYNSYFLGQGGLAEHIIEDVNVKLGPSVDKLGRFHTIGWYFDGGFGIYEPKAVHRVLSSSSLEGDFSS